MSDWLEAEQRVERAQELSECECWEEALREIELALSINPHNAAWQAQRGFLFEQLERCASAVDAYESALELDPGDPEVALALGIVLARLERFPRSLEVFEELARQQPDLEPAYCHRIGVYAELHRHDQAEEMFYLAQQLNDKCPSCFLHMGASLAARGLMERAIYCWQRVLELEPEYLGVNCRIAQAYRTQGQPDRAHDYYLRELRDDPGNTDLLGEMAQMAVDSGEISMAVARLRQILELEPDDIEAHYALGRIWLNRGEAAKAVECLEAVLQIAGDEPALPEFSFRLGEALLRLARYGEASRRLEAAAQQDVANLDVLLLLGNCYLAESKLTEAADHYRRVLALDGAHPVAHHSLGLCLQRMGSLPAALEHCLQAVRAKTDYTMAMYSTAVIHLELAQWREARQMLRRALRHDPGNADLSNLAAAVWRYRLRHRLRLLGAPFRFLFGRVRS